MSRSEATDDRSARELVITRVLSAPRELAFKAWTDPQHIVRWWGPDGFTITTHEIDVRPGGTWRYVMHGPDGVDYDNQIVYEEVVPPERLIYTHGEHTDDPGQFHVTVTFDEHDGKTRLTMRMLFQSAAEREKVVREYGAIEGANQTLNHLEQHLARMTAEPAESHKKGISGEARKDRS